MLNILQKNNLVNVLIVVTRYFGGTLLGTGGLVRAYSGAVKAGLEGSMVITRKLAKQMVVACDYTWIGKIQYLAAQNHLKTMETEYGETVRSVLLVPVSQSDRFLTEVAEATNGQAEVTEQAEVYYAEADGECLLFDH